MRVVRFKSKCFIACERGWVQIQTFYCLGEKLGSNTNTLLLMREAGFKSKNFIAFKRCCIQSNGVLLMGDIVFRYKWHLQNAGHFVLQCARISRLIFSLESFTVPLHSPNGRHLPAVRAVQRDCHWGMKNGGNSHCSHKPIIQWGTRQSQSIFRPVNHKRVMPASLEPCLISRWLSYYHQARSV